MKKTFLGFAFISLAAVSAFFVSTPAVAQADAAGGNRTPTSVQTGTAGERLNRLDIIKNGCPGCDLSGADLRGLDLSDANLAGATLRGANLAGAILHGANLVGADLTDATLDTVDLGPSPKGATNLSRALLVGASMTGTNLAGANLQYADLSCATAEHPTFDGAVFGPKVVFTSRAGCRTTLRDAVLPCELEPFVGVIDLPGTRRGTCPKPTPAMLATVSCGGGGSSGSLTTAVYVAENGTDSAQCGTDTDTKACKTLTQALANCTGKTGCGVLAMYGRYTTSSSIALIDGVPIYGGCITGAPPPSSYFSSLTGPQGGVPAITAQNINSATTLGGWQISATAGTDGSSGPSIAMTVQTSSGLTLNEVTLVSANGGSGKAADPVANGTNGAQVNCRYMNLPPLSTCGGSGAGAMTGTQGWPNCEFTRHYSFGGYPGTTGISASGGGDGADDCAAAWCTKSANGQDGTAGTSAACGTGATASSDSYGSFNGMIWTPPLPPASGTPGGDAGGGGGGGSGGACYVASTLMNGGGGGDGGAGGTGGQGGLSGMMGGLSVPLIVLSSNVAAINTSLVGGTGGSGGQGSAGGLGGMNANGTGGHDGDPKIGAFGVGGGKGGNGGNGGVGGAGGGGAGGNGGPSFGVALIGGSSITGSIVYYPGRGGAGGTGGSGGAKGSGSCAGTAGSSGNAGTSANSHSY